MLCENCGTQLEDLGGGGCGGLGGVFHCPGCGSNFEQVSGGILGNAHETLQPMQSRRDWRGEVRSAISKRLEGDREGLVARPGPILFFFD